MEEKGFEHTNVSLEEVVKSLSDYEKKVFLENIEKELPRSKVTLDDFDDDDIVEHLRDMGYRVNGW